MYTHTHHTTETKASESNILPIHAAFSFTFHFYFSFIYFERERVSMSGQGGERGRERVPSRLHAVTAEPDVGLDLITVRS